MQYETTHALTVIKKKETSGSFWVKWLSSEQYLNLQSAEQIQSGSDLVKKNIYVQVLNMLFYLSTSLNYSMVHNTLNATVNVWLRALSK